MTMKNREFAGQHLLLCPAVPAGTTVDVGLGAVAAADIWPSLPTEFRPNAMVLWQLVDTPASQGLILKYRFADQFGATIAPNIRGFIPIVDGGIYDFRLIWTNLDAVNNVAAGDFGVSNEEWIEMLTGTGVNNGVRNVVK